SLASDGPAVERYAKREFERWQQFVKNTKLNLED
ncbi:MAG: tripartite tricarboxylate transporter substrate binding protein, partial [Burkholderiaceae bacterium]|nr:tripartite tricarboxylate transporter substrate binding protein [Burkholderiaceae bacterium]